MPSWIIWIKVALCYQQQIYNVYRHYQICLEPRWGSHHEKSSVSTLQFNLIHFQFELPENQVWIFHGQVEAIQNRSSCHHVFAIKQWVAFTFTVPLSIPAQFKKSNANHWSLCGAPLGDTPCKQRSRPGPRSIEHSCTVQKRATQTIGHCVVPH